MKKADKEALAALESEYARATREYRFLSDLATQHQTTVMDKDRQALLDKMKPMVRQIDKLQAVKMLERIRRNSKGRA